MNEMGWKLLGAGATIAATAAATKVVGAGWRAVAGRDAPTDPGAVEDTSWKEALLYAAVLGLVVGAARVVAQRKAAEYYIKSTGHTPGQTA